MFIINSIKTMFKKNKSNIKEFGSSNKKLTMCKKCYTFYYRNSWHFDRPIALETDADEEIPVQFTKCTACLEQDSVYYDVESSDLVFGGM